MKVCIVGRGKLGRNLHRALTAAGLEVQLARGRSLTALEPDCDVYVLAVSDAAIRALASTLASRLDRALNQRCVVLHCAGARGLDELLPLAQQGVSVGVFHPLLSFASARARVDFTGATFTAFGDPRAIARARRLARLLGARCVVTAPPGASYHAAAALVANGAAALADIACQVLLELGFAPRAAEHAVAGLLASVASNVASVGLPAALTGPVMRGDAATVERHLHALAALDRKLALQYATLQPLVIATAARAGLDAASVKRLQRVVTASRPPAPRSRRLRRKVPDDP